MSVNIGNFLSHHRNVLFPMVYVLLFIKGPFLMADYRIAALAGLLVALAGQLLRAITIGLEYIKRGGKNRMPYADDLVRGGIFARCRNPLYVGNFTILLGTGFHEFAGDRALVRRGGRGERLPRRPRPEEDRQAPAASGAVRSGLTGFSGPRHGFRAAAWARISSALRQQP